MNTAASSTQNAKSAKKGFYFTEILMLKSIIALLILTFFLLNEMQASNHEIKPLKEDHNYTDCSMAFATE